MADITETFDYTVTYTANRDDHRVIIHLDFSVDDLEKPEAIEDVTAGLATRLHQVLDMRVLNWADDD